jgi:aspartyl-tRNA(Asn)/glutamyl-tRNA(Gln) amidotransferase subunit B
MEFDPSFIAGIKKQIPVLPALKKERLIKTYKVREDYAEIIVSQEGLIDLAEKVFDIGKAKGLDADALAGILVNQKIKAGVSPEEVLKLVKTKAERVGDVGEISKWVDEAVDGMPEAVGDYKKGKLNAIMAIFGRVMQLSKGKADPNAVKKLLEDRLKS